MKNKTNITEFANFLDNSTLNKKHIECCQVIYVNVTFLINSDPIVNHLRIIIPSEIVDMYSDKEIRENAFKQYLKMVQSPDFLELYETRIRIENAIKQIDEEKRLQSLN